LFNTWLRGGATLNTIIEISKKKIFHLEDAQQMLPVILRMTESANIKIKSLLRKSEMIGGQNSSLGEKIELEIDHVINQWQSKIEKLGAVAKGIWLADFDNGKGYFCWKFPERKIMFYHGYQDGFSGRKAIAAVEELHSNELI